jgi:hypothetical protein
VERIQKNDIAVKSGTKELYKIISSLKSGEVTFIDGTNRIVSNIEKQICVNHYKTYKSNIIYIDGGMSFNPYGIAKYARESEIDHRAALEHIHISRVFTLFQLTSILQDKLEEKIIEYAPKILIIGKYLTLYLDSEVTSNQVNILMKNNLGKIKEITKKYEIITILSNLNSGMKTGKNVKRILYKGVDQIVTIKPIGKVINFNFVKKNSSMIFSVIEKGQLRLNDFGMAMPQC